MKFYQILIKLLFKLNYTVSVQLKKKFNKEQNKLQITFNPVKISSYSKKLSGLINIHIIKKSLLQDTKTCRT